ncbi:MAG: TonB-dependent receptor [Melioribacteraceae bacterium]|nr:TonB-dependent receptor [Melioribacteraceae bacterium]
MIKKIFLILLLPVVMIGQENQGIELPDFVITGERKVSIPTAKKKKAKPISILSKEFFTPVKSPEEFSLSKMSKPDILDTNITLKKSPYNGSLYLGAGINTMPIGEFNYNTGSRHVLFSASVFGSDEREYIDNAGYNVSGASLGADFFISSKSSFIPGSRIRLSGDFIRDEYNLYGAILPNQNRKTQSGSVSIGLTNEYSNYINYGFGFDINSFSAEEDNNLKENLVKGEGYLKIFFDRFSVKTTGEIITQDYSSDIAVKNDDSYLKLNARADLKPIKDLNVSFGFNYSKLGSQNQFVPNVVLSAKLANGLAIFGEYAPGSEFLTTRDFLSANRYYKINGVQSLFTKHTSNIKAALKYEYLRFFEVNGGFGTMNSDNAGYFTFVGGEHQFRIANDISRVNLFVNLLFHLGSYGRLYGSINYDKSSLANDNTVPNMPGYYSDIIYGLNLNEKFDIETKLSLKSKIYSDETNSIKSPSFINFAVSLKYKFTKGLNFIADLNNLLNRDNFLIYNFEEKPLDAVIGIEYRW